MRSKVRLAGTVTMTVKGRFGGAYRTGCESDATAATRKLGKIAFVPTLSAVSILGIWPGKGLAPSRPEMAHRLPHAAIQVAPAAADADPLGFVACRAFRVALMLSRGFGVKLVTFDFLSHNSVFL